MAETTFQPEVLPVEKPRRNTSTFVRVARYTLVRVITLFITVVIGGMGSYGGAGIGALLLGMARAFGDFLALKFKLSPAIAEASTVIVMIIVLLVRPSGIFGKKE